MLKKHRNFKIKIFLSILVALICGVGIIYAANIAVPSFIIKTTKLKQDMNSVKILAKTERTSEVPESIGISETNETPKNVITKFFLKSKRLIDLPYKEKLLETLLLSQNNKNPNEFQAEEIRLLARFVPIKGLIEKYAPLYGVDPIWYSKILIAESALNPTSYNKSSKDYGIAQIKIERYSLAKKELLNPNSRYFSERKIFY
jgi:hypothetical protein